MILTLRGVTLHQRITPLFSDLNIFRISRNYGLDTKIYFLLICIYRINFANYKNMFTFYGKFIIMKEKMRNKNGFDRLQNFILS